MAANLNVTFGDMEGAATYLRNGRETLDSTLDGLRSYIQNLVSSGFVTDQASGAFNDTYYQFTNNASGTIAALESLATFLEQAATAMRETDQALANAIRGS
ncbi:MAG: WXG100 family type VII secretion target [Promicromonosporaceae bacterium]|nr:WXG100 family type VII secretion target [Promicromonosporaceae bacterium]